MRTSVFLVFAFVEGAVEAKKAKSTGCASKKIQTIYPRAFLCIPSTFRYPCVMCQVIFVVRGPFQVNFKTVISTFLCLDLYVRDFAHDF